MHDIRILERCHADAIKRMGDAASAIADTVLEGHRPTPEMVDDYREAKLGVESTRRDIEYCMQLELAEIEGT
jgi:uncharacterized protein with PhoU and TrkA domain